VKVLCQDQKDFNNKIKNIRHDLMFNEYPKEFGDSVMKPLRRNRPSSDTIFQGTVIIPYHCGRCYNSETCRPLEVGIKEQKTNIT
jgi:hypothetical protein